MLSQVLIRTDAAGLPTDYYIYGLGLSSRIDSSGKAYYYHYDGLGDTVAITDSAGILLNSYAYGPYGKLLNKAELFENPFRYVGLYGVTDEGNGLYYMRARYYDHQIGRFINKDPIGFLGGTHSYTYAQNNPLNWTDPLGLFPKDLSIPIGLATMGVLCRKGTIGFGDCYDMVFATWGLRTNNWYNGRYRPLCEQLEQMAEGGWELVFITMMCDMYKRCKLRTGLPWWKYSNTNVTA